MSMQIKVTTPLKATPTAYDSQANAQQQRQVADIQLQEAVSYQPAESSEQASVYDSKGHVYNKLAIEQLKADAETKYADLINTVRSMLEKQGLTYKDVQKALAKGKELVVTIDEDTRVKAREAVGENGFFGVKETANRIIDFARNISGDNTAKYRQLVNAIKQGFDAAKEVMGGKLPEISEQTYQAVMDGLENWKNGELK